MNTSWSVAGQFQFLPSNGGLEEEAIRSAVSTAVDGVVTHVMTAEHLVAIALKTGRAKDHTRILQFIEQDALDRSKLNDIVHRHGLEAKWKSFDRKFLEENR